MTPAGRLLLVFVALLGLGARSSSQTRLPADASPAQAAARALNFGHFDEVDALLQGLTDPRAFVLRAQADIQRGRYPQAEALLAPPAAANPGGDAALELGRLQLSLGRRDAARTTLGGLRSRGARNTAADFVRLGVAAEALSQLTRGADVVVELRTADAHFERAKTMAPADALVNIERGEFALNRYKRQAALDDFQAALKGDPQNVRALLGLAQVVGDADPPAAKKALEQVLAANPNYVPAHLLVAELALDDQKRDEARDAVRKALAVNPNSLEARALDGAIARLEGRAADFQAQADAVLMLNPSFGEFYRIAGSHLARSYRFEEAAELIRRAVALDGDNVKARTDLGMTLLRLGDEVNGKRELEAAFTADPYDVIKKNSLDMLDSLGAFETVTDGDVVMRFHKDEAAVMREYALPLAKEALATLAKRYEFTPTGPILIEMFPKHDDFAVRTLGLPGLAGALGVCFGKVVTLDSPKARPPGEFSWQETLWHELAHVITLQMSSNRVPRWLTEGISEWEETRAGRDWGRKMEVEFAEAMEAKKILTVKDLNEGFTDPRFISLAYYEASILVDHLVATYGEPALRTLLRAYGKGLDMDAALKEAYNATVAQIQTSFDARLDKQFGPIRRALETPEIPEGAGVEILRASVQAHPGSFHLRMRLASALHKAKDTEGAIREFERAAELLPVATGRDNPNARIAKIALERKDTSRAIKAFEAMLRVDHYDVEAARTLASLLASQGDAARTAAAHERVVALDPFDAVAQSAVGRAALLRRDTPSALRAFRAALAAAPNDVAVAHADLAEAYLMSGNKGGAKREVLAALEVAPAYERAQDLLLKTLD